jgi:hypothetical protein
MPSIGDLANDLARWAYDHQLLVIAGSVLVAVAAIVVAWRLGWVAAARRHPGRAVVAVLAVGIGAGPLAWYLASPIWIRTTLVEPEPVAVVVPSAVPSAPEWPRPSPPAEAPDGSPAARPSPSTATAGPITLARGSFHGTDDFHFGRGTATLTEIEPGRYHLRLEAFSVRNGPDLYVYLSPDADGYAADALELGKLKATDGSFGYDLPAGVDAGRFRSAIVWCKQFSHLFATAPFDAQG